MPSSYALGDHFERFVRKQVAGGRYATASEVIREALRLLEEREQHRQAAIDVLRAEIQKGLRSGEAIQADEVLGRLQRKYGATSRRRRE